MPLDADALASDAAPARPGSTRSTAARPIGWAWCLVGRRGTRNNRDSSRETLHGFARRSPRIVRPGQPKQLGNSDRHGRLSMPLARSAPAPIPSPESAQHRPGGFILSPHFGEAPRLGPTVPAGRSPRSVVQWKGRPPAVPTFQPGHAASCGGPPPRSLRPVGLRSLPRRKNGGRGGSRPAQTAATRQTRGAAARPFHGKGRRGPPQPVPECPDPGSRCRRFGRLSSGNLPA